MCQVQRTHDRKCCYSPLKTDLCWFVVSVTSQSNSWDVFRREAEVLHSTVSNSTAAIVSELFRRSTSTQSTVLDSTATITIANSSSTSNTITTTTATTNQSIFPLNKVLCLPSTNTFDSLQRLSQKICSILYFTDESKQKFLSC